MTHLRTLQNAIQPARRPYPTPGQMLRATQTRTLRAWEAPWCTEQANPLCNSVQMQNVDYPAVLLPQRTEALSPEVVAGMQEAGIWLRLRTPPHTGYSRYTWRAISNEVIKRVSHASFLRPSATTFLKCRYLVKSENVLGGGGSPPRLNHIYQKTDPLQGAPPIAHAYLMPPAPGLRKRVNVPSS